MATLADPLACADLVVPAADSAFGVVPAVRALGELADLPAGFEVVLVPADDVAPRLPNVAGSVG
ncbi:hypothetical protein [Actinoplanes sp. NPDC026670]|uniref:hypothetical protein n=1 Tax=Actinoplanes sp. NPDC026670 TaxID=3154700 RepID=UPI0033F661F3